MHVLYSVRIRLFFNVVDDSDEERESDTGGTTTSSTDTGGTTTSSSDAGGTTTSSSDIETDRQTLGTVL